MGRPTERQWDELCDSGIAALRRLRDGGRIALELAHRDMAGGFPSSSGLAGGGRGGGEHTVVEALADAELSGHGDPVRRSVQEMCRFLVRGVRDLATADGKRAWLTGPAAVRAERPAGSGDCEVCDRYCPGGPDRLRSGFCGACYAAWYRSWHRTSDGRSVRPERPEFIRMRSLDLELRRAGRDPGSVPAGVTLLSAQRRRRDDREAQERRSA